MKTTIPFVVMMALVVLSCTETVFVEVPGKTDTVKVESFIDRYFSNTDTVQIPIEVQVPVPTRQQDTIITLTDTLYVDRIDTVYQTQTVYVDRVDSIFITRTVYLTDTIVIREINYYDTLFISYGRGTQSIDPALWDMWLEFFNEAGRHGNQTYTGTMIVERVKMDAVQQAYSFVAYGQLFIKLNSNLTDDECMVPLWRELARQRLGKEYSQDESKLLYPFFPAHTIRWSNRLEHKAELDEFF